MNPTPSPRQAIAGNRRDLLVVLVLVAIGVTIYAQTLAFPFVSFDDTGYVVDNPHVSHGLSWAAWRWAWTSFELSNWHPLTWLSLMLDAQLYGLNAGGYHLTNLLLHLADTILLYRWLRTATGAFWPSAWTALFFVAHPLHVESVAWVTERKDVLSVLFFLLTLLAYTRYAKSGQRRVYILALTLFALGLTAKPMLVTLPALLLLLDFWPLRRRVRVGRLLWEKIPFFALVLASCAVTFLAQRSSAVVPLDMLPMPLRLASATLGYGWYLGKTFWPVDLGVYYPYWRAKWIVEPWAWGLGLTAVTVATVWQARRAPWLFVGWGWFLGTLVPVIGVVQVGGQAVADRYAYLPHIGLFIALCWSAAAAVSRWPGLRAGLTGAAAAGVVACVAASWWQVGYWNGSDVLFAHTTSIVQPTGRLCHLLGDALVEADRPVEAERAYRRAWDLGSHDWLNATGLSGVMLRRGAWEDVVALLTPLAHDPLNASDGVLNNLASALVKLGRDDEAMAVYQRCVVAYPTYSMAHFSLGELLQRRGDMIDAAGEYEAGLDIRDDWVPALTRLAWYYALNSNAALHPRAFVLARHAVDLSSGRDLGSLNALAAADASLDHWNEAVRTAQAAVDLARLPGEPAAAQEVCRARLETYRQGRLPSL